MPDPGDEPIWGQKETLELWEKVCLRILENKAQLEQGQFPIKELSDDFYRVPLPIIKSVLACWNVLKAVYGEFLNVATVRLIDMHFRAKVF